MERDINRYITILRQKDGKIKITHNINNEANIYQLLFDLGYRKTKLNNKTVYFQKIESDIVPVKFHEIQNAFFELLKNFEFENLPEDINYIDVSDWYLRKEPVKRNGLFNRYLEVVLNEKEHHILSLKTNPLYQHEFNINSVLSKLKHWGFSKSIDLKSKISTNSQLYYKGIGGNRYLIFSHFNSNIKKRRDGFDCWMATFKNENQIGKIAPTELENLSTSFKLERDFGLIEKYVA